MFNIGGGEFLVIAAIALIVLGPQRLPEAARQVGKVMGEVRRLSSGFQQELKGALDEADRSATAASAQPAPAALEPEVTPAPAVAAATRPRRKAPLQAAPVSKSAQGRTRGA